MKYALPAILLLAATTHGIMAQVPAPPGPAPAPIKITVTSKPMVGKLIIITAEAQVETIAWRVPSGLDVDISADGKRLIAVAAKPDKYLLLAAAALNKQVVFTECLVVVEGPPAPVEPDAMSDDIVALASKEVGPDAKANLKSLAAAYRQAIIACNSKDVKTVDDLSTIIHNANEAMVGKNMMPIRGRVSSELTAKIGDVPTTELTDERRAMASKIYERAAKALEGLK